MRNVRNLCLGDLGSSAASRAAVRCPEIALTKTSHWPTSSFIEAHVHRVSSSLTRVRVHSRQPAGTGPPTGRLPISAMERTGDKLTDSAIANPLVTLLHGKVSSRGRVTQCVP